jgi:hypothetical protein
MPVVSDTQVIQRAAPVVAAAGSVRISGHSDLLYWWVVWGYAAICASLTFFQGDLIRIGLKTVHVHPNPLVGISFVGLLMFVTVFTHARARGVFAIVFLLAVVVIFGGVEATIGWGKIFNQFPHLAVHMNMAFYVCICAVLLPVWLFVVFVAGRFDYIDVRPHQIVIRDFNVVAGVNPLGAVIAHKAGDPFMHWLFGLKWLGFGTGDIEISYTGANNARETHIIRNVWRAASKATRASAVIAKQ